MIQPVRSGPELIAEIDRTAATRPVLWWLGQSGFAIKYRSIIFCVDPYLSESLTAKYQHTGKPHVRMTAAPLRGAMIRHCDLVFSTHKHSDHLDPGTIPDLLKASAGARLVLPKALAQHAAAMGIAPDRMMPVAAGKRVEFARGDDRAVAEVFPSAHEQLDYTPDLGHPYLGYLFRFGEWSIYHPGDCVPFEGQVELLRPYNVTVALMPINGRDAARRVPGNFNFEEAAAFAGEIGARWLVPMHYDMFTFNTVDVNRFVDHLKQSHPSQLYKVFQCGEGWMIPED